MCPCQPERRCELQQGQSVLTACMKGLPVSPELRAVGLASCRLANQLATAGRVLLPKCRQPRTARPGHKAAGAWGLGCALEPTPFARVCPSCGQAVTQVLQFCWAFWSQPHPPTLWAPTPTPQCPLLSALSRAHGRFSAAAQPGFIFCVNEGSEGGRDLSADPEVGPLITEAGGQVDLAGACLRHFLSAPENGSSVLDLDPLTDQTDLWGLCAPHCSLLISWLPFLRVIPSPSVLNSGVLASLVSA